MYMKNKLGIKIFDNGMAIIDGEWYFVNSIVHTTSIKNRIIDNANYGIRLYFKPNNLRHNVHEF
jgi:hypothetical protein